MKKRHVFFVSGYDPKGAAFYHDLYATQGSQQAAISGYSIDIGERKRCGKHVARWMVSWTQDDMHVETTYDFLRWDDIMRQYWPRGEFNMLGVMARTYGRYISTGVLWRVFKTAWPTFIAAIYPALFMTVMVISGILAVWLLACASLLAGLPWWFGGMVGIAVGWAIIETVGPWLDKTFGAQWLVRIYAFNILQAARGIPQLDERLDLFAEHVIEIRRSADADEILFAGHSTGAQTICDLMARILARDPDFARRGPAISLLTLGGSIPMLGWLPGTEWFKEVVSSIVKEEAVCWVDFTAAQDGATFALQDPVGLLGLASNGEKPKVLSTKIFDLVMPENFRKKRHNWLYVHFHYMMASERPAGYDYFAITAGPMTLGERFAGRPSTKNFRRFSWGTGR